MHKVKALTLHIILVICFTFVSYAENSPYQFLRINSGARAAGLAGCFEAMPDDPAAVFFNPATIATVKEKRFSATFLKHVLDINSGNIAYISNFSDLGTFAGSVAFTNYGSFIKSDRFGANYGTFSANDIIASLSFANKLDTNLYYGGTLKFIYSNIEKYNSSAIAIDAGIIYLIPDSRTNVALSILNAGAQLSKYVDYGETVPLDVRFGINNRLRGLPLLINFSLHHLADKTDDFLSKLAFFSIAGELYVGEYIQLRVGYDNKIRRYSTPDNDKKFSGLTAGIGIKTKDINFDYGIAQIGSAATLHRIGLGLDF